MIRNQRSLRKVEILEIWDVGWLLQSFVILATFCINHNWES